MKGWKSRKRSLSQILFDLALWKAGISRLHRAVARARRVELASELRSQLGDAVLSGPFAGMVLPEGTSWRENDFIPKLLGSYESNLREALAEAVGHGPDTVVNVGCAEGYFAVGLARMLPGARIYAFDVSPEACLMCARAAEQNGVSGRVFVDGLLTVGRLSEILEGPGRILVLMDCEGAERDLLDPSRAPGLAHCDVIVETHGADITAELEERFRTTHRVQRILQGGRDPNEVPQLRSLAESDRWLLVDEGRPECMTWLALWATSPNST